MKRPPPPEPLPSGPVVYLLLCSDGSLYCGWTSDLARRLREHNHGPASRNKYTAARRPVTLAAWISVPDRSAALREEARVKRLPRRGKEQLAADWAGQRPQI